MPDEPQPWYRTPGAVFTAGGVGLVLVIALVITIVQMSDQWSTPASTFAPPPVATTSATIPPGVTTPTPTTATTYPTTVSLSTTDINLSITPPSGSETSTSGDVHPGDVHLGDVASGNHSGHGRDRGRRAHFQDPAANTSNQHHPHTYPTSD